MLSQYFGGNQAVVPAAAGVAAGIALPALRAAIEEVARERENNLAFRAAVAEHERGEIAKLSQKPRAAASGSGARGGGRRGGVRAVNRADLAIRPPALKIPTRVPRNLANMITWDIVNYRSTITTNVGSVTETNYSWTLTNDPQNGAWTQLYDQWCIVEACVSFLSNEAPSGTGSVAELHTALDFDNTSTLSTLAAIDVYGSLQVDNLVFNKKVVRSCKPCIKLATTAGNASVMGRQWCDSGANSTPWFGIRSMFASGATAVNTITVETTLIFAFRNSI